MTNRETAIECIKNCIEKARQHPDYDRLKSGGLLDGISDAEWAVWVLNKAGIDVITWLEGEWRANPLNQWFVGIHEAGHREAVSGLIDQLADKKLI